MISRKIAQSKTGAIIVLLIFFAFTTKLFAQEKTSDTLFIRYNKKLLTKHQHPVDEYFYYKIKDLDNKEDITYFIEIKSFTNLKAEKIVSLRKVLNLSGSYHKREIRDWTLFDYFYDRDSHVFLVKKGKYIEVDVVYEIE
ncbi:MAG: hypothetical protein ACPF80_02580 [Flavobacteriaceae bacterium]